MLDDYFSTVDGSIRKNILLTDLGFTNIPSIEELAVKFVDLMTGSNGFMYLGNIAGSKLKGKASYNSIEPTDE